MVKVKDIIEKIETFAPLPLAYPWDNTGLIIGDRENVVKKALVTLDVTKDVAEQAVKCGADMILSHHPILLNGIRQITEDTNEGKIINILIKNTIALYASHTSTDCTVNGLNDVLAQKLGIFNLAVLEATENGGGLGRIGMVSATTLKEFAETVKSKLSTPFVRVCGNLDTEIENVAVCSGSGADMAEIAKAMGADVLVTGDVKYHTALDAEIPIIDAGHFPTEVFVKDIFKNVLSDIDVTVVTASQQDIFQIV